MPLRISINANRIDGPWGGGNRFVHVMERYLRGGGHEVVRDLRPRLDAILMIGVQPTLRILSYGPQQVSDYLRLHPATAMVLRVNTCDEQRGHDGGINRCVIDTAELADRLVFPSVFLRELYDRAGLPTQSDRSVILTGADESLFFPAAADPPLPPKLRLVTHHWSTGLFKGFDIYERLDALLADPAYAERFEFTYIGRRVPGLTLPRTRWLDPMDGPALADELRRHHALVTGARHEPGGNHYIEAIRCGLPVLYRISGGNSEYCEPYGLGFGPLDFERKLEVFYDRYAELRDRVRGGPHPAEPMCAAYEAVIRQAVQARRQTPRMEATLGGCVAITVRSARRRVGRFLRGKS